MARPPASILDDHSSTRPEAEPGVRDGIDKSLLEAIRPPRFSPSQLAKLESITTSVTCECPQHLSTLLSSLVYFEAYCKDCESRNEADADVHQMLYQRAARARMLLEDGLERVLEHEDIRV